MSLRDKVEALLPNWERWYPSLFDAASGLLGVCEVASFEGQAPMLLESRVRRPRALDDGFAVENGVLDLLPLLGALMRSSFS